MTQNTLVRFAYESIRNPQKRSDLVATFAEVIGASAAAIANEDRQLRWVSLCVTHGMDRSTIDSYSHYYVGLNPWALRRSPTIGEVRNGDELLSEAEFLDTEFYHGWFKPRGWRHAASIVFEATETERTYLFAVRPPNHPFTETELALYKDLAPSLADAARIERLLMEKHQKPDNRSGARQMDIHTELINLKLSRTEARIALATFQGKTPKEYAHLAGIAETTVRWHRRQIYKELGVHSQADFMQLLLERLNY